MKKLTLTLALLLGFFCSHAQITQVLPQTTVQGLKAATPSITATNYVLTKNSAWSGAVIGSAYGGAGATSGILKANGSGVVSAAVAGVDYMAPGANTFTINGTGMALGTSSVVTAAAGTLTGTTLNSTVVSTSITSVATLTNGIQANGTGTTNATYSAKIQNSTGTNNGLMLHDNLWLGQGTDSTSEHVTDVNNANPGRIYNNLNINRDTNGLVTYKFGNSNHGGRAATRILIGDGELGALGSFDVFPATYTVGDIAPGSVVFGGGSNFNHLMIYNDGGGVGSPNSDGSIEMGTINTLSTGLTGLIVSGIAATQNFVGIGGKPLVDFHVRKSAFSLTAKITNTQSSATSITHLAVENSGADIIRMTMPSAAYTTNGAFIGRYGNIYCNGLGTNFINDNSGPMNFYLGGFASGNNYIQFANTGVATFGSGIAGTTTTTAAAAGIIGQTFSVSVAVGSAVTFTTATAMNIATLSLTAGDWDVEGNVNFSETAGTVTARSAGITTTTATIPTDGSEILNDFNSVITSQKISCTMPRKIIRLSATTNVYLVASTTFSAGTSVGYGTITARRVR